MSPRCRSSSRCRSTKTAGTIGATVLSLAAAAAAAAAAVAVPAPAVVVAVEVVLREEASSDLERFIDLAKPANHFDLAAPVSGAPAGSPS